MGRWGRDIWEPSSQKSFRSCDSSLWPLSSPHPLPQSCLYSTPPPPILSIPPSSPPLVLTAHHFHVSSAVGLIQTDCLTASKTYSHSQPPPFCLAFIHGNRHSLSYWRRCWCQSGLGLQVTTAEYHSRRNKHNTWSRFTLTTQPLHCTCIQLGALICICTTGILHIDRIIQQSVANVSNYL